MLTLFLRLKGLLLLFSLLPVGAILTFADWHTPIAIYTEKGWDDATSSTQTVVYLEHPHTGERWTLHRQYDWREVSVSPSAPRAISWETATTHRYVVAINLRTGTSRRVATAWVQNEPSTTWGRDGEQFSLIATIDGQDGVVDMRPFQGDEPQLIIDEALQFDASTDGSVIVYMKLADRKYTLFRYDPTTNEHVALSAQNSADYNPSVSPDGTHVVYTSQRSLVDELYLLDLTTGEETYLMDDPSTTFGAVAAWSPDGSTIAYTARRDGSSPRNLYLIDIATGTSRILVDAPSEDSTYLYWSPNGEWLTFRADRNYDGMRGYMIHVETGEILPLGDDFATGIRFAGFVGW